MEIVFCTEWYNQGDKIKKKTVWVCILFICISDGLWNKKKLYVHELLLMPMSEEYNCVAKTEPPSIHVIAK